MKVSFDKIQNVTAQIPKKIDTILRDTTMRANVVRSRNAIADADRLIQTIVGESDFNLEDFGQQRLANESLVTVEIGPGNNPVVKRRVDGGAIYGSVAKKRYVGQAAFIGVETYANTRFSASTEHMFDQLKRERSGENIFLVETEHDEHKPEYPLSSGIADEVFGVYVMDDHDHVDPKLITKEAARLLKPGGYFVLHDKAQNMVEIQEVVEAEQLKLVFAQRAKGDEAMYPGIFQRRNPVFAEMGLDNLRCDLVVIAQKLPAASADHAL